MKNLFLFLFTICSFLMQQSLQAQCHDAKAIKVANHETGKDVVDIAIGSPDHTTLVAAVKAADLVGTLKSDGPFTVFAPTNAAFEKLPKGTVDQLLKPENRTRLQTILTYHVVPGNLDAAAVVKAIKEHGGKSGIENSEWRCAYRNVDGR